MITRVITILVMLSLTIPGISFGSISKWISQQNSSYFELSPSTFYNKITGDKEVIWFGKIEDVTAYGDDQGQTIIEYYCRYLIFADTVNGDINRPYKVKEQSNNFFIFSIKAPTMSTEEANILIQAIENNAKIAIVKGFPYAKNIDGGKNVFQIRGDQILTADTSIIELVE